MKNVNAETSLFRIMYMEDILLELRRGMWLQKDGAPPRFARPLTVYVNINFPERWIGRDGHVD